MRALAREQEGALNDCEKKWGKDARTAMSDFMDLHEAVRERARQKQLNMPPHLRTGANPIDMGCPIQYITQEKRSLAVPVRMAVDPKWSTELKHNNDKIGARIEYERSLSAAVTGSMSPELPFMWPKKHLSNPPSPYFEPGKMARQQVPCHA